jgi:hypothetical protein
MRTHKREREGQFEAPKRIYTLIPLSPPQAEMAGMDIIINAAPVQYLREKI